jgi:hypothetical protein
MGQTNLQFNRSSTGGCIESLSDAEDQAKKAKSQEAPRGGSQASEEAEEAKREEGQCGRPKKRSPLAVFQREPGNPMRPPRAALGRFRKLASDTACQITTTTHYPIAVISSSGLSIQAIAQSPDSFRSRQSILPGLKATN